MSNQYPNPRWAYDAAAPDITETTDADRQAGWATRGEKPPRQVMNAIQQAQGEWAYNYSQHNSWYLGGVTGAGVDFGRFAAAGELGILAPDYRYGPLQIISQSNAGDNSSTAVISLEWGGVWEAPDATREDATTSAEWGVAAVTRSTTDTAEIIGADGDSIRTLSLSGTPTAIVDVATNGRHVAVAYDQTVDVFDCTDLDAISLTYTIAHGAAVASVAVDRDQVYLAGAAGTGAVEVRAFGVGSSTPLWTYAHGATVNGVDSDGINVYIGGNANGSSETVARLDRDTGSDVWASTTASATSGSNTFNSDGTILTSGDEILSPQRGENLTAPAYSSIACVGLHPRYLVIGGGNIVGAVPRAGWGTIDGGPSSADLGGTVRDLVVAPDKIIVGHDDDGSNNVITVLGMPMIAPARVRKADPSGDAFEPYRRLIQPL